MRKFVVRTLELFIITILLCACVAGCGSMDSELEALGSRDLTAGVARSAQIIEEELAENQVEYTECTLTLSCLNDEAGIASMKKAIQAFQEEYPGITIDLVTDYEEVVEETAEQEVEQEVEQQPVDMSAQDINQIEWEWLYEYGEEEGRFYDLYKEYEVLNLGAFGQEYLNICTISGSLQALPVSMSGKVFTFNESIFKQAGIEIPDTLEELMAAGEVFANVLGDDYYPLAVNIEDRMELLIYYLQTVYGKEWIVNGVLQYDIEEIKEGLGFLVDLEEAHVIPTLPKMRGDEEFTRDAGWTNGYYAGIFVNDSGLSEYAGISPIGSTIKVANRFKDMGIFNGGYLQVQTAFAVSNTCNNPREAALFLDYIFNWENGVESLKDSFGIPLSKVAKSYGEENELWNDVFYTANGVALDSDFFINGEYKNFIEDSTFYSDIIIGLSYGDYNIREAAQIFMGSF